MMQLVKDVYYSFPVQLFILHFRKYQVLLLAWFIIGSTISSNFMKSYGADALFFVPEYLGNVKILGALILGVAWGIFIMSWNITTFILHSKRSKFLATTAQPFLIYCINNSLLPLLFIIFYFIKLYRFDEYRELMSPGEIIAVMGGIIGGIILLLFFSFAYFFGATKSIQRMVTPVISDPKQFRAAYDPAVSPQQDIFGIRTTWFFSTHLRVRKVRDVSHYSQHYLDMIFKRHHFAAIISILLAFLFLIMVGFLLDNRIFQPPAAASVLIFFAVMIALIGALTYFMQSWSLPFIMLVFLLLDILYQQGIIDPRNKAYGLNYNKSNTRPLYSRESLDQLTNTGKIASDRANMISILENWKKKQNTPKPVMVFINISGGGLRSATFVMNMLQQLDSITKGRVMQHTMMISGSSGGMLAGAYYRELYRLKAHGQPLNLHSKEYIDNIGLDLLNPVFSSMIARDIFAPAQHFSVDSFSYIKDRGYAFEQKLNANTGGILDKPISDYVQDEKTALIPLMIFNSVITRDARKMMISSQPISFMMKPYVYTIDSTVTPDAVDFSALFAKQDPMNIRLLTALRMNAAFPYVLPSVWLPSDPVIDVMDAGVRDNFGQEITLRFIENFKEWLAVNTSRVIILQLRDRLKDNWDFPLETGSITDFILKPATMLQHNWQKLQDYYETNEYSYFYSTIQPAVRRITFMYIPEKEEQGAALNLHLTAKERRDVVTSFNNSYNQDMLKQVIQVLESNK